LELENQKMMGHIIDMDAAVAFCAGFGVLLRRQILASDLSDVDRNEMLAGIKNLLDQHAVTRSLSNEAYASFSSSNGQCEPR
jgi:hypothetical protein